MTNLYTLTGEMRELRALGDVEGELVVKDTLDAIAGEFKTKAEAIVHVSLNLGGDVDAIDGEIKRLQERKQVIQNRDKALREYLRENMEAAQISKISCPLFTITLAAGRALVVIDDETELPDEMVDVHTEIKPNKAKILDALKSGKAVAGASLGQSKSSIRIK
jgi:hypothetical protein